ncbi:MAG: hypothetical protein KIT09_11010 [Bryobacteraceae bacterium]|nr:hypothetical protein [Bryobacteraceae bacterium]
MQHFEKLYDFFQTVPSFRQTRMLPTRVVQFANASQFRQYQVTDWEYGHYEFNGSRDWIAFGPSIPDHGLAHEYVHLLVTRGGLRPAAWLGEGIAELFSTVRGSAEGTVVGDPVEHRLRTLLGGAPVSVETLALIGPEEYLRFAPSIAGRFYAQSWALTHMLYLAPEYSPRFDEMLAAAGRGQPTPDAMQSIYARGLEQIAGDLAAYWRDRPKRLKVFPHRFGQAAAANVENVPVSPFERSLVIADLYAVMGKEDLAKRAFAAVDRDHSALDEIRSAGRKRAAALAAIYLHLARLAGTQTVATITKVFELPEVQDSGGPEHDAMTAELFYEFAMFAREAKLPPEKVISALSTAVRLRPDYLEARSKLGYAYLNGKDYTAALAAFEQVPQGSEVTSAALNGFCGIAMAYVDSGRYDEAAGLIIKARDWARGAIDMTQADQTALHIGQTAARFHLNAGNLAEAQQHATNARRYASQKADIDELARVLDLAAARSKGQFATRTGESLKRARGTTQSLECTPKGALLKVMVDGKSVLFDLPGPESVEVTGSAATSIELRCGPLKALSVSLEYAPPGVLSPASVGMIRRMEF